MLFYVCLWGCFHKTLAFESVDWVKMLWSMWVGIVQSSEDPNRTTRQRKNELTCSVKVGTASPPALDISATGSLALRLRPGFHHQTLGLEMGLHHWLELDTTNSPWSLRQQKSNCSSYTFNTKHNISRLVTQMYRNCSPPATNNPPSDTSWVSYNLIQFRRYLPGVTGRYQRLRVQSNKTAVLWMPITCSKLWPVLLTNQL